MTHGDQQDITLGEIARSVKRIEDAIAPLAALGVRMNVAERNIEDLDSKMESVQSKSAWISGAISGVGAVLTFLFGKH